MRILTILTSLSALVFATDKSELILDIEKSLMASCFHGTVYEHGNAEMEKEIAAFVAEGKDKKYIINYYVNCLLYTSPSPRDQRGSRMPSSA